MMKKEELFSNENVLMLAKLTDKAQRYCREKNVEINIENVEKARDWLFKKQLEAVE
jgi:hypothetical protein